MIKRISTIRPNRAGLLLLPWLAGCSYYFDTAPNPAVAHQVEQRLQREEALPLDQLSKKPPQPVEQALPKFNEQLTQTGRKLPPEKLDNSPAPKLPPEASKQLSIAEARALALENNLDMQIALIDPKIAATAVSEEEAKFDDLIFARANYARKFLPPDITEVDKFVTEDPNSPLSEQTALRVDSEQLKKFLNLDAGITVPLRTGGKVTLSFPFEEKQVSKKGLEAEQYTGALRFSISQPLLRDGGIDTNVAGIRIARYEQQAVDVKTRLQMIRVLAAVERAYWGLYTAWGELDVRRQQYENAADNLAMVKKRVAAGLTAAVETNRAEIGLAERMEVLIVAETTLKTRQRQLKLLLNDPKLDLDSPTALIPATTPTLIGFDFDREQLAKRALDGRLELLELELKLAADLTKIDYLRNQTLPMFMLDYNYASPGRDPSSFGGSFDQAVNGDYSDWSVGLRMEMPLTNERSRARLERAVQERLQRLTSGQLRELSVRREIYDALDQVGQNWRRILAARQNVLLAGINYDAELKQFREGLRTMTEVLETLTRLGEAQLREVRAIGDYQVSLVDLAFATGTLLGHSHIGLGTPVSAN
ncbi:MAG: TolC family protein [Methylobacter sp.]